MKGKDIAKVADDELRQRIQRVAEKLSGGARSIAELILSRPEEVALLPAAKVARQLGVSESTVVRFASTLGYDGYPAMRRALQMQLRRSLNPVQRLRQFAGKHNEETAAAQSFRADLDDLAVSARDLSVDSLAKAVALISSARQVYVLGLRGSFGLAFTLAHQLNQMISTVRLMNPAQGDIVEQFAHLGPDDVVVGISFPRYTRLTVEMQALASRLGAKVIALTDGPLSPLAAKADVLLTARCSANSFATSSVAALALINALLAEYVVKNRKDSVASLARLEELVQEADMLFFKDNGKGKGQPSGA